MSIHENIIIKRAVKSLTYLMVSILDSLKPDYLQQTYLYEKRIRDCKNKVLLTLSIPAKKINSQTKNALHQIYYLILDCSQIRWREQDPSIFALCKDELAALKNQFKKLTVKLNHDAKKKQYFNELRDQILRLEDAYHHVLNVVVKNPVIIVVFIENLKDLSNLLEQTLNMENYVGKD